MKRHIALVLALLPSLSLAETNSELSAVTTNKTREPQPEAFVTFKPDAFQQRLFLNPDKITQTDGEGVYKALCAGCHMPDRKGAVGAGRYPALAGNENVMNGDYPVTVIVHGQKAMPPFGDILDDDQIVAVVSYLQKDFPQDQVFPATKQSVQAARESAPPAPQE